MIAIVSDKEKRDNTNFMAEAIQRLYEHEVKGIAIIALCDDENLTGYWNMTLKDKREAETEIRFDVIDEFIKANRELYFPDEEDGI